MVTDSAKPSMDGPATYRIRVMGRIEPAWVERISRMVATESMLDGEVVTELVGRLADQAAFSGVLSTLYGLHLPVLSAEWLGEGECEESGKGGEG
jgi:hypothetical protein